MLRYRYLTCCFTYQWKWAPRTRSGGKNRLSMKCSWLKYSINRSTPDSFLWGVRMSWKSTNTKKSRALQSFTVFHCHWYLILRNHHCLWSLDVCEFCGYHLPLNLHLHDLATYIMFCMQKAIYFTKMVTQDILSQGTNNLQLDFKYQSRRNYQYLIISITLPVYLCIEYQFTCLRSQSSWISFSYWVPSSL